MKFDAEVWTSLHNFLRAIETIYFRRLFPEFPAIRLTVQFHKSFLQ